MEQDGQLDGLFVEDTAGAALFDPTLELAVVSVVRGVGDFQVVDAILGLVVDTEIGNNRLYNRLFTQFRNFTYA